MSQMAAYCKVVVPSPPLIPAGSHPGAKNGCLKLPGLQDLAHTGCQVIALHHGNGQVSKHGKDRRVSCLCGAYASG